MLRPQHRSYFLCCRSPLILFGLLAAILAVSPVYAGEDTPAPAPTPSASPTASSAPDALAAPTEKIILSVPDAGGLRMTITSDNNVHVHVAGKDLPPIPAKQASTVGIADAFNAFTADTSGYVNGGSITLKADHKLTNIFGTGLDIKVLSGTKLTATTTGIKLEKVDTGGGVALALPLKDSAGNKTELDIAPLTIDRNGALKITASLTRQTNVNLPGGFSLAAQSLGVVYAHSPGSDGDDATITLTDADIKAPIPGVLTQNPAPLTFHVASATVNTDGQISFQGAKLSQTAFGEGGPTQVASLRGVGRAKRRAVFPLDIPLMKPADFIISIQKFDDVTLSMENNVPSEFTLACKVTLPSKFSTAPVGGGRVVATGVTLDAKTNGFVATIANIPQAYFKGFGVTIQNAVLDLSETKTGIPASVGANGPSGGDAWEGLYLGQATLILPDSLKVKTDSANGTPPDLAVKNAWIDNNGFSGEVTLTNGTFAVEDFDVKLDKFDVSVARNQLKKCDITGNVAVTAPGGNPFNVNVEAAVSDSGLASLHVKTGTITLPDFGAEMTLENGTLQRIEDKNSPPDSTGAKKLITVLALSGNWKFTKDAPEVVQGLSVQIKDLQVDSTGKFTLDSVWLDLPDDANLDFDVVSLDAKKIGFGGIGSPKPWIGFTGAVSVSGDLPIQGQVDFDGLYIYKGGEIHVGRIGVDLDVRGVLHISGFLEQSDGTLTRSVKQDGTTNLNPEGTAYLVATEQVSQEKLKIDGKPITILTGKVAIQLPILGGGSGAPGGALQFLIARNSWFVMGSFSSTTPLIPIGQSGLSIYGFGGGLGYNVKPEFDNATGIPQRNYQIIPDTGAIAGTTHTASGIPIIALASIRLGSTVTPPPIWGDVTFVANLGDLTFSLQGDCYLGEVMTPDVPAIADQKSRVLSATISYDVPNATFVLNGYANFDLPKKEMKDNKNNSLVHMYAPFRFKIGNYDAVADKGFDQDTNHRVFYAALGGPVDLGQTTTKNGITAHRDVVINNPVTVQIRGLDPFTGAIAVDMNRGQFRAAVKLHQTFSEDSNGVQSIDLEIATLKYAYKISGELDAIGWLELDFPGSNKAMNMDSLSASGEFYLYAFLSGQATNLELDTFFHNFGLKELGVTALLEADLSGSLTPSSFNIHGQVHADLDFYLKNPIKDIDVSLPFSKDVEWSAKL